MTHLQARKAERAAQELTLYALIQRFVQARLDTLTPGVDTKFSTYSELLQKKEELTLRIGQATLESEGWSFDKTQTRPVSFCTHVVLARGGSRRVG